jgi:hypothetical protein
MSVDVNTRMFYNTLTFSLSVLRILTAGLALQTGNGITNRFLDRDFFRWSAKFFPQSLTVKKLFVAATVHAKSGTVDRQQNKIARVHFVQKNRTKITRT